MGVSVQDHYATKDIVVKILAAIGVDAGPLSPEQVYPYDQLHGRELLATRDHVARLRLNSGMYVLDIGAGIGGPARFIAHETGAQVTGIDLTPAFVEAAKVLSDLTGQAKRVDFVQGNAEKLPFDDAAFDAAVCFYVGMNLPHKPRVLAEMVRVLRPGARLIWTEAVLAVGAAPTYPLPWAAEPSASFLVTREALCDMVGGAGLAVEAVEDETAAHVELARARMQTDEGPPPEVRSANSVVMGPDFAERRKNYITGLAEGNLASLLIEATKPA